MNNKILEVLTENIKKEDFEAIYEILNIIKEELKKKHEIQKLKAQQASVAQVGHTDKNTKVG